MSTTTINPDSVLAVLSQHIGKARGISVRDLSWNVTNRSPKQAHERQIRYVVTALRLEGHHICAHPSSGYYIAANEAELEETCKYLFDRGMTSLMQVSRMKKISLPDLHGQLKLLK